LESRFGTEKRHVERFKVVAYEIPKGCAATYFPEANPLVAVNSVAAGSNHPASKAITLGGRASGGASLRVSRAEPTQDRLPKQRFRVVAVKNIDVAHVEKVLFGRQQADHVARHVATAEQRRAE